jgi:hypothetical protein
MFLGQCRAFFQLLSELAAAPRRGRALPERGSPDNGQVIVLPLPPAASVSQMIPRSRLQLNRSVRPQEPRQEMPTKQDERLRSFPDMKIRSPASLYFQQLAMYFRNANAMLTFERTPKLQTPKFSSSSPIAPNSPA